MNKEDDYRKKTGISVRIENNKLIVELYKDGFLIKKETMIEFYYSLESLNKELDINCVQEIAYKKDLIKRLQKEVSIWRRLK